MADARGIEVDGTPIEITNPHKVFFPEVGLTKSDIVDYYLAVGPGILRALRNRPTTLERWPDGVREGVQIAGRSSGGVAFFQKRVPAGAPEFVRTCRITFPSGRHADEVCPDNLAAIAWAVNLGTITFHPWPVRASDPDAPDELRIDVDPQPGTGFGDAVQTAHEVHAVLDELGMTGFPKTSGGRGLHIYVRIEPQFSFIDTRHAAIGLGRELVRRRPDLVTVEWWKEQRGERVFIDFNQNARDRTLASAYSVRARPWAPVSAPVTWDELDAVDPRDFTVRTMPTRFAKVGDPHAAIDEVAYDLSPLLELYERFEAEHGNAEMPYPPEHPKMAGEPKRVQPSRDPSRRSGTHRAG